MKEMEEIRIKAELEEITQRIDNTMRKIETVFEPDSEKVREPGQ